jgi:hypothetical protein
VAQVRSDVSEEIIASIIQLRIDQQAAKIARSSLILSILMMEAINSCETSSQATSHNKDSTLEYHASSIQ